MKCSTTTAQVYKTFRTVYLPAVDYIKQQILDNKAAQTEIQGHCYIEQTEVYKCHFHSLRTTLTD